jgi:hypothetical protein
LFGTALTIANASFVPSPSTSIGDNTITLSRGKKNAKLTVEEMKSVPSFQAIRDSISIHIRAKMSRLRNMIAANYVDRS